MSHKEIFSDTLRKKIAAELVRGGFEIAMAREFMGINKMPMQYYLKMRGIKRPKLGKTQTGLRARQRDSAIALLARGATPKEIFDLTGVSFSSLHKILPTAYYAPHQETPPQLVDETASYNLLELPELLDPMGEPYDILDPIT